MSALGVKLMVSVVAVLVATTVTAVAQAPEDIALVPNAAVPAALVVVEPPAVDTAMPSCVATPVPRPETPVLIGRPVALVNVPDAGVPRVGVTNVGDVAKTSAPLPVSSVTVVARLALDGVPRNAATPVPRPETPVLIGRPVALVNVPEAGVPSAGVTSVGEVANTSAPDPVSPVTAAARLADEGVAKNVATPAPNPEIPVDTGKPVQLVRVPLVGVPKTGVTNVGDVAN